MEIKQYEQKTKTMTSEIYTLKAKLEETIATKDTLLAVNRHSEVEAIENNQGRKPKKEVPNNESKILDDQEKFQSDPIQEESLLVEPLSKDQNNTHSNNHVCAWTYTEVHISMDIHIRMDNKIRAK